MYIVFLITLNSYRSLLFSVREIYGFFCESWYFLGIIYVEKGVGINSDFNDEIGLEVCLMLLWVKVAATTQFLWTENFWEHSS